MEPSYSRKLIFNMTSVHHLEFENFWIFVTFPSPWSKFASAYQISSNSDGSRLRYGDITIFKMAAVHHVAFSKLTFSSPNLCERAIVPPHSKFHLSGTIWSRVIANKMIFNLASVRHLQFRNFLKFSHVYVAWVKICDCIPNFVVIGRFTAEIRLYHHIVHEDWV